MPLLRRLLERPADVAEAVVHGAAEEQDGQRGTYNAVCTAENMAMPPTQLVGPDTMNAPWGVSSSLALAHAAINFFDMNKVEVHHHAIGKALDPVSPLPLTVMDFLTFLQSNDVVPRTPSAFRLARFVAKLASTGVLLHTGGTGGHLGGLEEHYLRAPLQRGTQRHDLELVAALGPALLYHLCAPSLVHITGTNAKGATVAGTGLVIDATHVLTCRHVVNDMTVDPAQTFQHRKYSMDVHTHADHDVAILSVHGPPLTPVPGTVFRPPSIAETVYTLGYPKLPGLRNASVTMQPGAVTNESVTSLGGDRLFLFSAISRPGNSGGPVTSDDGYVVGLAVVDTVGEYGPDPFSPHYAGIPSDVVVKAANDLALGLQLPLLDYD